MKLIATVEVLQDDNGDLWSQYTDVSKPDVVRLERMRLEGAVKITNVSFDFVLGNRAKVVL